VPPEEPVLPPPDPEPPSPPEPGVAVPGAPPEPPSPPEPPVKIAELTDAPLMSVTTLEIRQSNFISKMMEHEMSLKNHGTELNLIHVKQAVNASDLAYIRSAIDRIEKKIP